MKLSVVIPAYNEAENIVATINEVRTCIGSCSSVKTCEIIVVDDCSSDKTFDLASQAGARGLRLSRRSGSHVALRAGFSQSSGDIVLCLSADGQDDPSTINEMIEQWKAGNHVVWALRRKREEPLSYKLMTMAFYGILKLMTDRSLRQINLSDADFFLMDKKVIAALNQCPERNTSLFGLLTWVGFRQTGVQYNRRPRVAGTSKFNFRTRMRLALDWIVAFSGLPLRLISLLGFAVAGIGFLYALVIILNAYTGTPPPGWSETVILILVLGGFQMMISGIIGEYLWRTLDETRRRPLFFIEKQSE